MTDRSNFTIKGGFARGSKLHVQFFKLIGFRLGGGKGEPGWRLLRPVWLELRERLFGARRNSRSGFLIAPPTNGN